MADWLTIITVIVVGAAFPLQVLDTFRKKTWLQAAVTIFNIWILVENVPAAVRILPAVVSWALLISWIGISWLVLMIYRDHRTHA